MVIQEFWVLGYCGHLTSFLIPVYHHSPQLQEQREKKKICSKLLFHQSPTMYRDYTPIAFDEKVGFCCVTFNAPGQCLMRVGFLHCMCVQLRKLYSSLRAMMQIM